MARPSKNNAEYFSHDADMRNNRKVKALRRRFSHKGYAVWCFILETLTDADYFEIKFDEVTQDLLAADFDITNEELQSIVAYCVKIRLLQMKDDTLYCEALKQRFSGLIEKRRYDYERYLRYKKKAKSGSDTESKINEVKTNENEDFHRENDVEIDNEDSFHRENSTVKESILNNSKEESKGKYIFLTYYNYAHARFENMGKEEFLKEYFSSYTRVDDLCKTFKVTKEKLYSLAEEVLRFWELDNVYHIDMKDAFNHMRNHIEKLVNKERTPEAEEYPTKKRRTAKTTEAKPKREMNYDDTDFGSIDK